MAGISGISLLSGCVSHSVSSYSPSFSNINALLQLNKTSQSIALGKFTDPKQRRTITCRLEGVSTLPGNVTYVEYIKNALQEELKNNGLYSNKAKIKPDANLDEIDSDSSIGKGS